MAYIGFSILLVSFTFLCYRHPPSSWACFSWFRRDTPRIPDITNNDHTAPVQDTPTRQDAEIVPALKEDEQVVAPDRKAMPPPPIPKIQPPVSKTTPVSDGNAAKSTTAFPSERPPTTGSLSPPRLPSFPAANSAQRASGGYRPPTLAPPPRPQPPLRSVNSLAPPPTRSPLPNRSPVSASSLSPPATGQSISQNNSRKKVLLTPGHSPLDWAMLSRSPDANLRGLPASTPYLRVPPSLLRQQTGRKGKDAWTVLGGKVYNITPYLPYHPGGEAELMKAAGRDGTKLFTEIHPWVNWETMLDACLVGIPVAEDETISKGQLEEMD